MHCGKGITDITLEKQFVFESINNGTEYRIIRGKNRETEGALVIPAEYGGLSVTSIWHGAFNRYSSVTEVVIPESVTEIGRFAFSYCTALKTIIYGYAICPCFLRRYYIRYKYRNKYLCFFANLTKCTIKGFGDIFCR